VHGAERHPVGRRERLGERILEHAPPRRVRARLEERPDAPAGVAAAQRRERTRDRGRVVREVVDHGDAAALGDHLLAALHSAERRERRDHAVERDLHEARERDDADRVRNVHRTGQRQYRLAPYPWTDDREPRRRAVVTEILGTPRRARTVPEEHGLAAARRDDVPHLGEVGAGRENRGRTQSLDQRAERALHVVEIAIDVGVIELDRVQEKRVGIVVEELRSFVEERRVVLVALGDEPRSGAEAEVLRKVPAGAADHEARIAAGFVQHPREHGARRRLPVRPHDDRPFPRLHEEAHQRLGHRAVGDAGGEHPLDLRVAARHRVADDDEIGPRLQVLGAIAFPDGDPEVREHVAHRRIDRLVRARHIVAGGAQHAGERGHAHTRDRGQVDVPRRRRQLRTR